MLTDYSYCNEVFVDGLKAFLDYTTPHSASNETKEGLVARKCFHKQDFEKRCIQRWAISELADLITDNPHDPVEETSYKFTLELLGFEKAATDTTMKRVFRTAADFIEKEVINLFRAKEGIYP